uniref:Large ribosomal subunit protein mL49 n=1 Tax=Echinococcus granulosus TaxID=6210 RepID=A0A068WNV4_ECHGR|nr:39S ribosomal protein L49 mitochondrial [Echinococcus granulosus]
MAISWSFCGLNFFTGNLGAVVRQEFRVVLCCSWPARYLAITMVLQSDLRLLSPFNLLVCAQHLCHFLLMAFALRPVLDFMATSCASCSIIRHVSVKSWPTLDNPWRERLDVDKKATFPSNYVVSKEEFKFVEMLKPMDTVPPPPVIDATPSGWVPPRPEVCSKKPYTVTRSRNHMLPVYLKIKERKRREQTHGKRMLTVITKVGGDISALAAELETLLKGKCETGRLLCQVDEVTQKIIIDGVFLDEVAAFLIENGF